MPDTAPISIEAVVARWRNPATRPAFVEGTLVEFGPNGPDGPIDECKFCAQGDILARDGGWSPRRINGVDQPEADREIAQLLGISVAHSVLLRNVNDSQEGCPEDVLAAPGKVLGDQAGRVLAFWRRLDAMTADDWRNVAAARAAAWDAAWAAAWDAARDAAGDAARDAAEAAAWDAAEAAAWAAARDAAGDAARDAAGDAAWAAARVAARDAAEAAAWDAAEAAAWAAAGASNEIQGARVMRERGQPFTFLPLFGIADPDELES